MRLDQALKEKGLFESREKAKEAILNGVIQLDGKTIKKPAYDYDGEMIELINHQAYVSRSALKLKEAFDHFKIALYDQVVLDIGASTGGFTQIALEYGAKKVYALDVGMNQLHEILKNDSRVISLEGQHFLESKSSDFEAIDIMLCDVSFISSIKILSHIKESFNPTHLFILFKPQFEANQRLKNPVIKDPKLYQKILNAYEDNIHQLEYEIIGSIQTIKGKQGNQERLYYLRPL